jgi:predicted  nucleic acid-binding Zn-ribbon protein
MAQTEEVVLLEVKTLGAVKNVNDLKENIAALKHNLGQLDIGTKEYQETLNALKVSQNALKDAMHGTSASMDEVVTSAMGISGSYNALVHQMAALKEEWRATNDEARRNELGKQIAEINQQLKDMDASVGNFQRNVGNYESGVTGLVAKIDQLGGVLRNMPPTLGSTKEAFDKVGASMQMISVNPVLGIIGLLAPIIMGITKALKDNEVAMGAVKKLMDALKPVTDVLAFALDKVAEGLSNVVDWLLELIGESGLDRFISKVIGVGNAVVQYFLVPIKTAIAAVKGFYNVMKAVMEDGFKEAKAQALETGKEIADAWKTGFSFKVNFEEGTKKGEEFVKGARANASKAREAGEEIGKEMAKGVEEGLQLADVNAALAKGNSRLKAKFDAEKSEIEAMDDWWAEEMASVDEGVNTMFEENLDKLMEQTKVKGKMTAEEIVGVTMDVANATSGLMSTLADMYESDEKNAEKNAKKIKALRIASATIDMLNGAVAAFASAQTLPPPFGQIVGAANAAAVIAMGVANINKIKSTNPTGGADATASASAPTPASVSAPNIDTGLQSVRNVTSASEEERLNRMAQEQRVYILQSDIEAAGQQSRVQVAESSF